MTTSLVRKQPRTPVTTPAAASTPDVDVAPAPAVAPLTAVVPIGTEPARPPLHLLLTGLRRRALGGARAESETSDAIGALVAERAQARADARYRNDEGGMDDDGGWG